MTADQRSFDWRCRRCGPCWRSSIAQTYVYIADEARRGVPMDFDRALVIQGTSHRDRRPVAGALLAPAPTAARGGLRNILILGLAVVPVQLPHTVGWARQAPVVQRHHGRDLSIS